MSMEIDMVTVTYNSGGVLREVISSAPKTVNMIVVDNASSDGTVALAKATGANVVVLNKNIGYGSACNVGASAGSAQFLLFTNPDARFKAGAIPAFLAAAMSHPHAAFNPRFYKGARRRFRRWSRLLTEAEFWQGPPPEVDCEIPVLSGACIFIRREHFERVGGFDENIFLFNEDDDLSVRLREAGLQLRIANDAIVEHAEGHSAIRSADIGRIKGKAMGRSLAYVMHKHGMPLNVGQERLRSLMKLLLPHILFNTARRAKLWGFILGLNSCHGSRRD